MLKRLSALDGGRGYADLTERLHLIAIHADVVAAGLDWVDGLTDAGKIRKTQAAALHSFLAKRIPDYKPAAIGAPPDRAPVSEDDMERARARTIAQLQGAAR